VTILVTVNPRKCMANQVCSKLAPQLFKLGEAGYSQPTKREWDEADLQLLREAADNCPTGAITVEVEEA
jgi:ferredoxin